MSTGTTILISVLSSGAVFSFIQFLITRFDKKKDLVNKCMRRLDELELNQIRLQILFLIQFDPMNKDTILALFDTYRDKGGNSYIIGYVYEWYQKTFNEPLPERIKK